MTEVRVIALEGLPELRDGDDLALLLHEAAGRAGGMEHGDVVVVAQKAVSKVEGRVVRLADVEPSERARELAGPGGDPRHLEVILRESREVVRSRPPLVIAETRHGFVCASAGVDASNAPDEGTLVLLPLDPDASAARLRARLAELSGVDVGVIVSDSFGRAWRQGTTDVALGVAGLAPLRDLRGTSRRARSRAAHDADRGRRRDRGRSRARARQGAARACSDRPRRRRARRGHRSRARDAARARPLPLSAAAAGSNAVSGTGSVKRNRVPKLCRLLPSRDRLVHPAQGTVLWKDQERHTRAFAYARLTGALGNAPPA